MQSTRYKRQTLALFFIVSLIPALTVAAVWYVNAQLSDNPSLTLNLSAFILPVFFLGIFPALILSYVFAEILSRPVRQIRDTVVKLTEGDYSASYTPSGVGEFDEIKLGLATVAAQLRTTISETESETALIEAERNKLSGVLNSMTDGVFALDRSGRIILFNKAASELTGRTIAEVAGQLAEKVMPFRQNGELVMTRWLATQTGTGQRIGEWRGLELYRSNGTSLFVDVQAVVLPNDPNGINALVTFHDLTKSHQLEEMKIDFVALAAHELRTPLTEIRGYLDVLQHDSKGLKAADRAFLERAVMSATQLGGLVNNLLNVARIEHGELNYSPEPLNYHEFVEELVSEYQPRFKQEQRTLELSIPVNLPHISADPVGIREVFRNIIENAITHTSPKVGTVKITIRRHRDEIETSIADNGKGIPASSMSRLFTKFFRGNELQSTTRGTGLGLYICRSIVEAHGGHIWVESTEGQGATFIFRLPIRPVASTQSAGDNTTKITRGAHGWIKSNSVHRGR